MSDDARVRVFLLAALAVIGLALTGAVSALEIGGSIAGDDRVAEVSIAGSNISVSSHGRDIVLLENVSETSDIEIAQTRGEIVIAAREDDPFTRRERKRAIKIARHNETVESYLETVEDVEFTVEPVKKLTAKAMQTTTVTVEGNGTNGTVSSGETVQIANVTVEDAGDSVTVDRDPSYVEHRAVVMIGPADQKLSRYWVDVDLRNGTVTDITNGGRI